MCLYSAYVNPFLTDESWSWSTPKWDCETIPMHWLQGKCQLWEKYLMWSNVVSFPRISQASRKKTLATAPVASVLIIRPDPSVKKRIGTSWTVLHACHNSKPNRLEGTSSSLDWLHLAPVYRYCCYWEDMGKWCHGSKVNAKYERIASRNGFAPRTTESQRHLSPPSFRGTDKWKFRRQ